MIATDQPTIFPSDVLVRVSSSSDGTMLDRTKGTHSPEATANRRRFCKKAGTEYEDVVYQQIIYDDMQTYQHLEFIDKTSVIRHTPQVPADGLLTAESGVGLLLPVADCVASVLYDPSTRQLAMLHLGRHSTLTLLLKKTINQMVKHGSDVGKILVWMSPSAQQKSYVMEHFAVANDPLWVPFCRVETDGIHVDLVGYNRQICVKSGILPTNIEVSHIDTVSNNRYFSHSRGDTVMRFAVLAVMQ